MDEWGFPIQNSQQSGVDEWGFPVGNPTGGEVDEWGFPVNNDTSLQDYSFQNQKQAFEQHNQLLMQNSYYVQQSMMYHRQSIQAKLNNCEMRGIPVRYTNKEILDGLTDYVGCQFGVYPMNKIKLEDFPNIFRHACAWTPEKLTYLPQCIFNIPEVGASIPFYFCKCCGTLYFPQELAQYSGAAEAQELRNETYMMRQALQNEREAMRMEREAMRLEREMYRNMNRF